MSPHLIKEVPVDEQRVVWLGQLASQKGEEPAHLGGREVWVVHHDLGHSGVDEKTERNMTVIDRFQQHLISHWTNQRRSQMINQKLNVTLFIQYGLNSSDHTF